MRTLILSVAFFSLAACDREPPAQTTMQPGTTANASPGTRTSSAGDSGVFIVSRDGGELYRESFQGSGDGISSTIASQAGGERVEQNVTLGADGAVEQVIVTVHDSGGTESQRWKIAVDGENVTVEGRAGGQEQQAQMQVPRNTIPVPVDESVMMVEQIIRHARQLGGETQQVSLLSIKEGKPSVDNVSVTFTDARNVRVQGTDSSLEVETDADGRILSARDPGQNVVIEREAGDGA